MKSLARFLPFVIGLAIAWTLGYFLGAARPPAALPRSASVASATPFPEHLGASPDPALTSTAIGRLIEGQSDFGRQMKLFAYAESLDASSLPGAVSEAMQLPLKHRNAALSVLFARWAEIDPAAAARYAQLLPRSANAHGLRHTALTAWAEKDLDSALAWASALEPSPDRSQSIAIVAGALAKSDPNAALKLVQQHLSKREAQNAYNTIFSTWAENDFVGAVAAARSLEDPNLRSSALRAALNQHIEKDPRLVLDIIGDSKISDLRWNVGNQAIARWVERDLAAAREYALNHPAGELRSTMLSSVVREMVKRDPQEGLDWVLSQEQGGDFEQALQTALSAWAERDPQGAIQAAKNLPEGATRDQAFASLAQSLVETDLESSLALTHQIPEGDLRQNALHQIGYRWARIDPKAAAEWMLANTPEDRRFSMHQIMWEWSRSDPEAALQWATSLPEARQKGEVLSQVLTHFARANPQQAADLVEKLAPETQRAAVSNFVANWASRDPAKAAAWAASKLADDQARSAAMSSIASTWGNRDPSAAGQWLEKLKPGKERDSAVNSFVHSVVQRDPEGAIAWAVTIANEDIRMSALTQSWSVWARASPDSALQWAQTTPMLTEAQRQHFSKPPSSKGAGNSVIYRSY
jgi:hypothetical protein